MDVLATFLLINLRNNQCTSFIFVRQKFKSLDTKSHTVLPSVFLVLITKLYLSKMIEIIQHPKGTQLPVNDKA